MVPDSIRMVEMHGRLSRRARFAKRPFNSENSIPLTRDVVMLLTEKRTLRMHKPISVSDVQCEQEVPLRGVNQREDGDSTAVFLRYSRDVFTEG